MTTVKYNCDDCSLEFDVEFDDKTILDAQREGLWKPRTCKDCLQKRAWSWDE